MIYQFDRFILDLARGGLRRGDQEIDLRPKTYSALCYLVTNPGRLIAKDELIRAVWPTTSASDESLARCISELRTVLGEGGQIKAIPKRGYVFTPSVNVGLDNVAGLKLDGVSLAVLPFTNLEGNEPPNYFADGLTEDIITELSKYPDLVVIARNTTFQFKGRAVDVRAVGRDLGVRFVLEGSVRRNGNQLRVISQLVDAQTGVHLWAERYDRNLTDVFAVQDELTRSIVGVLAARLEKAEAKQVLNKSPSTWQAYDCVLRGLDLCNAAVRKRSVENIYEARRLFFQALAIDDKYARAYSLLSYSHHLTWIVDLDKDFMNPTALERGYAYARAGVDADPSSPQARAQLGSVLLWKRQHDASLAEFAEAKALNPQFFDVRVATTLLYSGEPTKGIEIIRSEMRRDPYYSHLTLAHLGNAHFGLRQYAEGIPLLRRAIWRSPKHRPAHVFLAASLAQNGLLDEAHKEADEVLRIEPNFALNRQPQCFAPYRRKEDAEHFIDGLRKAGLPEA